MMSYLKVTRICHASVLIDFGGNKILTDPWFSERSGYYRGEPLGMTVQELPKLDGVVVSHKHYDHYDMEAFQVYPDKKIPFAVKRGTAKIAKKYDFHNVYELDPWETVRFGSVKITATPAKHNVPENTYILEYHDFTLFFGGDTLNIPELAEIHRNFPKIDAAFLPINGLSIRPMFNHKIVMNAEDAARLCSILRPRIVIPIHYSFTGGSFMDRLVLKYNGTPNEFINYVDQYAPETTVKVLEPGIEFDVIHT